MTDRQKEIVRQGGLNPERYTVILETDDAIYLRVIAKQNRTKTVKKKHDEK